MLHRRLEFQTGWKAPFFMFSEVIPILQITMHLLSTVFAMQVIYFWWLDDS